jgi:hypothetical protein
MSAASLWQFDLLLQTGSLTRISKLRDIMDAILRNPTVVHVLDGILAGTIDMKSQSHDGSVYMKRRHVDLGNFMYGFLYCCLARLSREYKSDVCGLFILLGKKYTTLAVNAPFTDRMLWMKGDVIECILAQSLLTGAAIDPVLKPDRHALQQNFRDFDAAMHDVYKICFQSWAGPPTSHQLVNVADFSAMVLLAHRIQTTSVPNEWYAAFFALAKAALVPLRIERD